MSRLALTRLTLTLSLVLAATSAGFAQQPDNDTGKAKVNIGDKAPAFRLPDHDGRTLSLDQLLKKKKHVALVFHRSASW